MASLTAETSPPATLGRNTVLPWLSFSRMTAADLGAIHEYLRTVPAHPRVVNSFPNAKT
jgi:hypothetical protein